MHCELIAGRLPLVRTWVASFSLLLHVCFSLLPGSLLFLDISVVLVFLKALVLLVSPLGGDAAVPVTCTLVFSPHSDVVETVCTGMQCG